MAGSSCTATANYDLSTYDTQTVVAAFKDLEAEIKERYKLLQVDSVCSLSLILRGAKRHC